MNTNGNHTLVKLAFENAAKAVAMLCCLCLVPSCDKKVETVKPSNHSPATPSKWSAQPSKLNHRLPLDSITQQIKAQGGDWNARSEAITMVKEIGERKQVEAIPSLIGGMLIIQPFSINNAVDYAETYPCSAALVQIGESAVPQIQSRFLVATSNLEQLVLLDTLMKIKGAAFVADWINELPKSGAHSLSEQRRTDLKQWALSQAH